MISSDKRTATKKDSFLFNANKSKPSDLGARLLNIKNIFAKKFGEKIGASDSKQS
jgi:hypothetical protein